MITKNAIELNRKSNQCKVISWTPDGVYHIKSPSGSTYTVDLERGGICTCAWGQRNGAGCSHEMAARKHWEARTNGRSASFQAGDDSTVARQQHKAVKPVAVGKDSALTMVLRDRDPLHGVVRFCESWDGRAVDLFRENGDGKDVHERVEGADYDALIERARKAGWSEVGLYWWRNVAE